MSYFYGDREPIRVATDALELPTSFVWRRVRHTIRHVGNQWRVDTDWWRRERVWRDFFQVVTSTGLLAIIYRDLCSDEWFLHRVYD